MTYLYEAINPTRLYIKQCSHCDKRYLGKTTKKNIETYSGSGVHWSRHLKSHNAKSIHVWNSSWFYDKSIVQYALELSEEYSITDSNDWFNLKPENGLDGGKTPKYSDTKEKEYQTKIKNNTHLNAGSQAARNKAKTTALEKYGTLKTGDADSRIKGWKTRQKNGTDSGWKKSKDSLERGVETRKNNGTNTWTITETVECPHCGKIGKKCGAMVQAHFDNCKMKQK